MRQTLPKMIHVLALGLWFGGAAFFNFIAAVPIFESFKQVVYEGPSDRTAYQQIVSANATEEEKKALASALAGAAVGPVFPRYFAMQAVCGILALTTAISWWNAGRIHRWRVLVLALAVATVAIAWPISNYVSELRLLRFDQNRTIADAAVAAFGPWHLASLLLSCVTVLLAGIALAMAARLPAHPDGGFVDKK